jgi:hypothetical protein
MDFDPLLFRISRLIAVFHRQWREALTACVVESIWNVDSRRQVCCLYIGLSV